MNKAQISILRIKNMSEKRMRFLFAQAGFDFELDAGESTEAYPIPLPEPGGSIAFIVSVADGGLLPRRTVMLGYRTTDKGRNEFRYEIQDLSKKFEMVDNTTTPGSDVSAEIWYAGDGVVIVGTGDM